MKKYPSVSAVELALGNIATPDEIQALNNCGIGVAAIASRCEGIPLTWTDILLLEELFVQWNRRNLGYRFRLEPKSHKIIITEVR